MIATAPITAPTGFPSAGHVHASVLSRSFAAELASALVLLWAAGDTAGNERRGAKVANGFVNREAAAGASRATAPADDMALGLVPWVRPHFRRRRPRTGPDAALGNGNKRKEADHD